MSLLGKVTGLDWTKYGIILAAVLAYTAGVYGVAAYRCNISHERQKTEQAEAHTKAVVDEVKTRVPQVQATDAASARKKEEIAALKRKLDEALKNRPETTSCDLSDDEFASVLALAHKTHASK